MSIFNWFKKLKKQGQAGYSPETSDTNRDSDTSSFVSEDYSASSKDNDSFNGFDGGDFGGGGSGGSFDDDNSSSDSYDSGDSGDSDSPSSD